MMILKYNIFVTLFAICCRAALLYVVGNWGKFKCEFTYRNTVADFEMQIFLEHDWFVLNASDVKQAFMVDANRCRKKIDDVQRKSTKLEKVSVSLWETQ